MATTAKAHRLLLHPKEKGDKALFHLEFSASFWTRPRTALSNIDIQKNKYA